MHLELKFTYPTGIHFSSLIYALIIKETWLRIWVILNVFWVFCGEEVKMKANEKEEDEKEEESMVWEGIEPATHWMKAECGTAKPRSSEQIGC